MDLDKDQNGRIATEQSDGSPAARAGRLTRRDVVKGSAAAGAAASLAAGGFSRSGVGPRRARAQGAEVSGRLVSWGYGAAETNQLAFARVEAFRQAYPNVELELVPEADTQKILTAAVSDTLPDLLWLPREAIASYAGRGSVIAPITEYVERDGYDVSRHYENAVAESTYEDQLYGIPGGMDIRVIYANMDHLAEVGITDPSGIDTGNWDQLRDLGGQLIQREGDVVRRWGFDHKIQAGAIYLWGNANGAKFLSEDAQEATFNDPKAVEALDWGVQAYEGQGTVEAYDAVSSTWQNDEQFARGQVSLTVYESWMMTILSQTVQDLNFAVLPLRPRGASDGMTSLVGGRSWCISAGAQNPDAAWEFIKFMHSDETWLIGQQAVKAARDAAGQVYIPGLTASKTADAATLEQVYEPINPRFDAAVQLFPQILTTAPNREIAKSPVSTELDGYMRDEAVLPALRGEKPAEEALTDANESAQAAIDEFIPAS
ncbi:MAG: hypothetical protein AVDCRST_MAG49-2334 [uncultured Thermomicrobiales bacterium]|uniref:ABC transporter, substrate-binding protein (Cluster 1, maltose/g3p/polyamine/iron) n=1 Tax=uncultured Thermomicrobiales bacterium TaxID=1645740 RepID=A0A6J4UY71_9BACT|nr:MAG: hypothetical protein AVDCRST_MAG49-2334 [uncultured Thermomicrobiales bacterium]